VSDSQQSLSKENQQLLSWGIGVDTVANFVCNVSQIDTRNYTISMMRNSMQYRNDLNVAEAVIKYQFESPESNLDVNLRFRNNHFSHYQLDLIESSPIFTQPQPNDLIQNANNTLHRYQAYSGAAYVEEMSNLLPNASMPVPGGNNPTEITDGNHMKLQITVSGATVSFFWMYFVAAVNGGPDINYQSKGLEMVFQNSVLTAMTDGYYLFTIGSSDLSVSQGDAVHTAETYVRNSLTWKFDGKDITGFKVANDPISVQLVPHTRGGPLALVPYWYVELKLDQVYSGGYNIVTVGIYGDNGQVADVQMLSANIET
jgi:hypothetical protein